MSNTFGNFGQVSCPSAPTAAALVAPFNQGRGQIVLVNQGTTDVFVGPVGVGSGNGLYLAGVKGQTLYLPTTSAIYCVAASSTQTISFMEINV